MALSQPNKFPSTFMVLAGGVLCGFFFIGLLILTLEANPQGASQLTSWMRAPEKTEGVNQAQVLGTSTQTPLYTLQVNVPAIFSKRVTMLDAVEIKKQLTVGQRANLNGGIKTNNKDIDAGKGKIIGSNIIYSLLSGANISITGDPQHPTVNALNTGVSSIAGQTGALTLTSGSGISLNGLQVGNTGVLTLQGKTGDVTLTGGTGIGVSGTTLSNTDPGTGQNIFKIITAGGSNLTASTNNDQLTFAAGSGITITGDPSHKTVTITSDAAGVLSGLTPNGVLYATSATTATSTNGGTNGYILKSNGPGTAPDWVAPGTVLGFVPFDFITSGTNTTAAMVIGSGASIGFTGTGTINASTLGGATFATPGAIGTTTPGSGAFTTLSGTSVIGTTFNGLAITNTSANTLTIATNKTFTVNNSLTLAGTDGTTITFPGTSGTAVTTDATQTLTNKTITAGANTITGLTNTNLSGTAGITNANLANASVTVTAGSGLTGGGPVSLGSSITLTNAGVISLSGTTNQVTVSGSAGALTLSLPQDINAGASPKFAGLKLSNLTSSGGLLYTDGTGTAAQLGTVNNSTSCLISQGTGFAPAWGSCATGTTNYLQRTGTTLSPAFTGDSLLLADGVQTTSNYRLEVNGKQTGKALVSLNETGDQALLTASASGLTKFTVDHTGNISAAGNVTAGAYNGNTIGTGNTSGNNTGDVTLNGAGQNYLSIAAGQVITANQIDLNSANVKNILPIANGGTGSNTQNFVDLSTVQTAAGAKTWSNLGTFNAGIAIAANQNLTLASGTGNLGIGTTTPGNPLAIASNAIDTANGAIALLNGNLTSTTNTQEGIRDIVSIAPGATSNQSYFGAVFSPNSSDSTNLTNASIYGLEANPFFSGAGTLGASYGMQSTITNANALGVITNTYGIKVQYANTGVIGTSYGLYIAAPNGTVTNKYALVTEANAGNVGIGTTNPASKLDVAGVITTSGPSGVLHLSAQDNSGNFYGLYSASGELSFYGGLNIRAVMTAGGKFGLGLNNYNPLATLDVQAEDYSVPVASFSGQTGKATLLLDQSGVGDLFTASKSGATKFVINNAGNVGIGTTVPGGLLTVGSGGGIDTGLTLQNTSGSTFGQFYYSGNDTYISAERLTTSKLFLGAGSGTQQITLDGNTSRVGIGATTPTALLDLSGSETVANGNNAALQLSNTAAGGSDWFIRSGATGTNTPAGGLSIANDSNYYLNVTSAGNFGFGPSNNNPLASVDIRANSASTAIASVSGATNKAALVVDNSGNGDLFTASSSGATKFAILNNGDIKLTGGINLGGTVGTNVQCLLGGSSASWGSCSGAAGTNYWQLNSGAVSPFSNTADLLVGGIATSGASTKFAFTNVNSGTPTAIFGGGEGATPTSAILRGAAAVGSNIAGGTLTLAASNGTGSGGSGDLIFQTASPNQPIHDNDAIATTCVLCGSNTWSHTTTAGNANRILIVGVTTAYASATPPSGVTYAGQALTQISNVNVTAGGNSSFWYLLNPPTGANSVIVTATGATLITGGSSTFYNVDQTSPLGTAVSNTGSSYPASVTANTTNTSQLIVDSFVSNNASTGDSIIPGLSQTKTWFGNGSGIAGSYKSGISSSTNMSWTDSRSGSWAIIAVPLNPSSSGAGTQNILTDRFHISASGALALNGDTTVAANKNLVLASGTGQYSQTFTGTSVNAATITANSLTTGSALVVQGNYGYSNGLAAIKSTGSTGATAGSSLLNLDQGSSGAGAIGLNISNSGGAGFTSDIQLQNGETIDNTTDNQLNLAFGASGGTLRLANGSNLTTDRTTFNLINTVATTLNIGGAATTLKLGAATGTTAVNNSLTVGSGSTSPFATLDVRGNSGTTPVASVSGNTAQSALVVDQSGVGDIFTASKSGATKFTIQNSGTVVIGTTTNGIVFDPSGGSLSTGIYRGTAQPTKQIVLSPEYAGAVLTASGAASNVTNGIMTSDASPSANYRNYYQWISSQNTGTPQQYTVAVRMTIPKDFAGWATSVNAMTMDIYTNLATTTSNSVDIIGYRASDGAAVLVDRGEKSSSAKIWKTVPYTSSMLLSVNPGDTIVFYITMYSQNNMDTMIGDLVFNYLSKF